MRIRDISAGVPTTAPIAPIVQHFIFLSTFLFLLLLLSSFSPLFASIYLPAIEPASSFIPKGRGCGFPLASLGAKDIESEL